MSDLRSPAVVSKYSSLYKVGSPPTWKESYKRRCTQRLKSSRAKLLQKYRDTGDCSENNELSSSIVDDVMREEWESIQKQEDTSYDFNSVLADMEQVKLELMLQEREILLQHDRLRELEETDLHSSVAEHENTQHQTKVICPICRLNYLEKFFNMIQCCCGMQIDTEQDSITLSHVDIQLRVCATAHAEKCNARPVYGVVQDFGPKNLLMSCNSCDFMFVVI